MHLEHGYANPIEKAFRLQSVFLGLRRSMGDQPVRKHPITPAMLLQLHKCLDMSSIEDTAIWAAATVAFYAMLRRANVCVTHPHVFNSERHLTRGDISLFTDRAVVTIRHSKTIQFKERSLVLPLARLPGSPLCPVSAIEAHFHLTPHLVDNSPAFITALPAVALLDKVFITAVKRSLKQFGHDSKNISGHSFRRGGATFAFISGVPIDRIRMIGDWQSNAYIKYICDNSEVLFNHFKHIGEKLYCNVV